MEGREMDGKEDGREMSEMEGRGMVGKEDGK